jgi:hypothetical protein
VTDVLPIGYVTLLQAAEMLQASMFGGVPDQEAVKSLRRTGVNVRDGLATDRAIDEIWKAVDAGSVRAMVVGGSTPADCQTQSCDYRTDSDFAQP